ncbi:hypothetical protein M2139_001360 [Enterococcus sp. PF1-24]|uniref:Fic family protein n=1 Tax=unclassified Enterococcus TaxID=2608891 RepID=UPI002475A152|nr:MULTISPECIES: Fic family protein [unclassified Enterococcus]MDH6364335.1 hypothetical protein [Enterococcus sp. PFB1-1]MDH6401476.1 hypothetical protein [Enterococcus sp. PF1-24]
MDNTALARFITSLGSLNSYGSTVLQTKQALDSHSTKPLRQDADDIAIFTDALKSITAIQKVGFSTEGIIAINTQFDSPSAEQPKWPGHLRNAYYNEDDRIGIIIDENTQKFYTPKEIITKADLDEIVKEYQLSNKIEVDAWRVFARLCKLQAFQDGNKRTALIAANAAYDTFSTEEYLVLPFNDLDRAEFTIHLMRYYKAEKAEAEEQAFQKMMAILPSKAERLIELKKPITEEKTAKTLRLKPQFRNNDKT